MNSIPDATRLTAFTKKFKSNQLSLLVMGCSLATITTISLFYGLTRPCVFGECPQINQAEQIYEQTEILSKNNVSDAEITLVKTNLELAINLLHDIPFWSNYHQESSQLKNQYQQQLDDILLLESAINQKSKALLSLSLSESSPLSLSQLEALKQEFQAAIAQIKLIQNNEFLEEVKNQKYKEYSNNIQLINQRIVKEKRAFKSLEQAKSGALLAQNRENTANNVSSLELVYNSWTKSIKSL